MRERHTKQEGTNNNSFAIDPSPFSPDFNEKMNQMVANEGASFIKENRGYLAGAAAIGLTLATGDVVHANDGTCSVPQEVNIWGNCIGAGVGAAGGAIKELVDKERTGESSAGQLIGNAVIGGVAGLCLADLGQLYYNSIADLNVADLDATFEKFKNVARTGELLILFKSLDYIRKTTGPLIKRGKEKLQNDKIENERKKAIKQQQIQFERALNNYLRQHTPNSKEILRKFGFTVVEGRVIGKDQNGNRYEYLLDENNNVVRKIISEKRQEDSGFHIGNPFKSRSHNQRER